LTAAEDLLFSGFLRSASLFPDRPAIAVQDEEISYRELRRRAQAIAATLQKHQASDDPALTAVFAYRSAEAFSGVLGALMRGHGYVPLNRTFPAQRTGFMLERSGCSSVIVDRESASQLNDVLKNIQHPLVIVLPDHSDVSEFRHQWPEHRFLSRVDVDEAGRWIEPAVSPDSIAYLLFTSGSTGKPKGVMVTHSNVRHYLSFITERYGISERDRLSQTFDMTFDLSVSDMFIAWERGACVCCPAQKTLINPGQYIKTAGLTIWFSVPSMAVFMKKLGALKPNSYPHLRFSLFCGEPLPEEIAAAWHVAAPNSVIENLYGPTELTIACAVYRWNPAHSNGDYTMGLVPIGEPFPGMDVAIVDENLNEVAPGTDGELAMSGPQLSLGYWKDPEKTSAAFVSIPSRTGTYYKTGDRVRSDPSKPMVYLGRMDHQVKILGHRVELGEIESVARELSGIEVAIAVPWPIASAGAGGVELFLQAESYDSRTLLEKLRARLPSYMVPRKIHLLKQFPLNPNGKYDRKALAEKLEEMA
jgi:amino acid adenylation domain-containing protein